MKRKEINLTIPVILVQEDEDYCIISTKESEAIIGNSIVGSGKTFEDAANKFWDMARYINEYHKSRSHDLDRWKPFQKGNWKHTGGSWFTVFGINVYFRRGKNMKGGWYIPFTKMNISITNYWRPSPKSG
jgi:hypothetical protein